MALVKWDKRAYHREYMRSYRKMFPAITRKMNLASKLKLRHKMTIEEYNAILQKQNGLCAICGRSSTSFARGLHMDHDHVSGKYRGLLCGPCNVAIGLFREDTLSLEKAIEYLKLWR